MEPTAKSWLANFFHEAAVISGLSEPRVGDVAGRLSQKMRQVVALVVVGGLGFGFVIYWLIPMMWPSVLRPGLAAIANLMGKLSFLSLGVATCAVLVILVGHLRSGGKSLRSLNWGLVVAIGVVAYLSAEAWMAPRVENKLALPVVTVVPRKAAPTETDTRAFAHPNEEIGLAAYAGWCVENQTGEPVIRETDWLRAREGAMKWWSSASTAGQREVETEIDRLVAVIGVKRVDGKLQPNPGSQIFTELREKILSARKTAAKT